MQLEITQEHILLYIYNELEAHLKEQVETSIATNPEHLKFYQKAIVIIDELNRIQENPSETTLQILNEEARSNSFEVH
jgi:hypothetical protein